MGKKFNNSAYLYQQFDYNSCKIIIFYIADTNNDFAKIVTKQLINVSHFSKEVILFLLQIYCLAGEANE